MYFYSEMSAKVTDMIFFFVIILPNNTELFMNKTNLNVLKK